MISLLFLFSFFFFESKANELTDLPCRQDMKCRGRQGVEVKERREGKISAAEFSVGRELQTGVYIQGQHRHHSWTC